MSETFTLQVKRVPVELRWKLRQAAANVGQGIGAFVIGVLEEVLDGKRGSSRSASTRDANLVQESSESDLSGDIDQREITGWASGDAGSTPAISTTKRGVQATPILRTASTQSGTERSSGSGGKRAADQVPQKGRKASRPDALRDAGNAADEAMAEPGDGGSGSREASTTAPVETRHRKSEPIALTTSDRNRQLREERQKD